VADCDQASPNELAPRVPERGPLVGDSSPAHQSRVFNLRVGYRRGRFFLPFLFSDETSMELGKASQDGIFPSLSRFSAPYWRSGRGAEGPNVAARLSRPTPPSGECRRDRMQPVLFDAIGCFSNGSPLSHLKTDVLLTTPPPSLAVSAEWDLLRKMAREGEGFAAQQPSSKPATLHH